MPIAFLLQKIINKRQDKELVKNIDSIKNNYKNLKSFRESYELIYDIYNELGMKPNASDNYDSELDIPEPPVTGGLDYWLSLSFPHPEWNLGIGGVPQEYFTSDLRELRDISKLVEVWDATILSSSPGSGILSYNLPFTYFILSE